MQVFLAFAAVAGAPGVRDRHGCEQRDEDGAEVDGGGASFFPEPHAPRFLGGACARYGGWRPGG